MNNAPTPDAATTPDELPQVLAHVLRLLSSRPARRRERMRCRHPKGIVMTPYLTDTEIADICDPLVLPAAQTRHLRALGLLVKSKPNGKPLVARSEFERVMCQSKTANDAQGPNVVALNEALRRKKA